MATNRIKAVTYCRVSSDKQVRTGHGLSSQDVRCREYASRMGYEVIASYQDEGQSGKLMDRPKLKEMLADLKKSREQIVVIIDDISRLARDVQTHIALRSAILSAGGKLESPSIEFGEDSDSRLVEHLLASVAAHQREKNAEQVRNRMRARAQQGFWVAPPPVGYQFQKISSNQSLIVRKEPQASIVQEALESFASGRFETQTEIKDFLESHVEFPRGRDGKVHYQRIKAMLTHPLYSGRITLPKWDIYNVKGKHEALISYETYLKNQDRLRGVAKAPARKDLSLDFPLRGFVSCSGCGEPLTSGHTKGRYKHYPYYFCHRKTCSEYGKAIKKDQLESDFDELLNNLRPSQEVFELAKRTFDDLWEDRKEKAKGEVLSLKAKLAEVAKQSDNLVAHIAGNDNGSIILAYERKLRDLEEQRIVLEEKIENTRHPTTDHSTTFRTAYKLLENPVFMWHSERLEDKRTVLRTVFTSRMPYCREEGFRTAPIALPFRVLRVIEGGKSPMVPRRGLEPPRGCPH